MDVLKLCWERFNDEISYIPDDGHSHVTWHIPTATATGEEKIIDVQIE